MTKLGAQPGVHGGEDVEKEAIKIDPKVFTVLQPTIIPMPAPPAKPHAAAFNAMRACLNCLFFVTCLVVVTLLGLYFLAATPEIFKKIDTSSLDKPQMEALISAKQVEGSSEKAAQDNGIVAIPLARVVVVEDISNNDGGQKKTVVDGSVEEKSTTNLDRPLHPDEIEQYRMMEARQQYQRMMEEQAYVQQMMAMRMMRMRRLQAAYYQQQQMKMAYFQQQQQMQEEAVRQQWAERARYEEDQQQRRQWEAQQAFAQQQQRAQAFWQQHQIEMQAQAQQAHAQMIQQQQQQQQPQFMPRAQWQRPSVWQQPPQQFFFPQQQPQQHQQQQSQEQMPEPFFQPAPQPSVHDRIYEELQKKSQNIPVNAPTRQIWTAITPTPAPEEPATEAAPMNTARVTLTTTPSPAEISDTILKDIFSAFDEQKNSEAASKELTSTTERPIIEGDGAIVIEDSFPRIEERTTTPEPIQEDSDEEIETSSSTSGDHEKELDPFAAVLKFFENNPPRSVLSVSAETSSSTEKPLII